MIEEERRAEVEKEAVDTAEEERKAEVEKTVEWIEELVKKGNITKIQIKKDGNVYINIPLNIGIVGTVIGLADSAMGFTYIGAHYDWNRLSGRTLYYRR